MLRKALPQDLDFIYNLYMHPQANPWLLYEQMSREEFIPVYNDLLDKSIKYVFHIDETNAGMVKIIPRTYRAAHTAYIGGVAVDPALGGRGYGRQLMKERALIFAVPKGFSGWN